MSLDSSEREVGKGVVTLDEEAVSGVGSESDCRESGQGTGTGVDDDGCDNGSDGVAVAAVRAAAGGGGCGVLTGKEAWMVLSVLGMGMVELDGEVDFELDVEVEVESKVEQPFLLRQGWCERTLEAAAKLGYDDKEQEEAETDPRAV